MDIPPEDAPEAGDTAITLALSVAGGLVIVLCLFFIVAFADTDPATRAGAGVDNSAAVAR